MKWKQDFNIFERMGYGSSACIFSACFSHSEVDPDVPGADPELHLGEVANLLRGGGTFTQYFHNIF